MGASLAELPPPKFLTAAAAAVIIPSTARIVVSGFATIGLPQAIIDAMIARFRTKGAPGELTLYHASGHGSGWGYDRMAEAGMVGMVVGGHWGLMNHLRREMMEDRIESHNWPQGMLVHAFREMARGNKKGFTSTVGLGTYIDPRATGGCMNNKARARGSMIRLETTADGEETLRYAHLPLDYSIIRGWEADALGNVSLGMEALSLSQLDLALAARAQGGKVICQVRRHHSDRQFPANEVAVPGFLIDHLVVSDNPYETHRQCEGYDEASCLLGGASHDCDVTLPPVPIGPRGWIGRRAAREILPGDVFNLGIGIPGETVAAALAESGRLFEATSTLESGIIGGVGIGGNNFGIAINPQARIDQSRMFDFYHGGGLDITLMGAAEIGANGDINVSLFEGMPTGCGGFIDITQNARRIVFCSTLTAGSLDVEFEGDRLRVRREGRHRKFVRQVRQVTFSAQQARHRGTNVLLITERCVFKLNNQGWEVTEVAPGIELERDVFNQMEFRPTISPRLQKMDIRCFNPGFKNVAKGDHLKESTKYGNDLRE
jgi:propionate CoA-transferase